MLSHRLRSVSKLDQAIDEFMGIVIDLILRKPPEMVYVCIVRKGQDASFRNVGWKEVFGPEHGIG
jgi:hypothetical protein